MTQIDIGPYRLESYSAGWTIGKPRTRTNDDGVEEEYLVDQIYPGTLTQALTRLQDIWLRESSATSFDDLRRELTEFKAELAGLFEVSVREPDKSRHRKAS